MEADYSAIELHSEIGCFIVEFEGLLQTVRDCIVLYLSEGELIDTVPVEILIHDSTSSPLADYYQAISLHVLLKKHATTNGNDVVLAKKYIRRLP